MSELFITIFNLSIAASWLIAAVIIIRALISKRMPKWISCCLWGLVAVRLLIPFTFESDFSLVPDRELVIKETVAEESLYESQQAPPVTEENLSVPDGVSDFTPEYSVNPPITEGTESVSDVSVIPDAENSEPASLPEMNGTLENEVSMSVPPVTEQVLGAEKSPSLSKSTADVLGYAWFAGLCLMLMYSGISALLLKRRVALSVPYADGVRKGESVDSPFVFGMLKPRIYIPYGLGEETERCVIAHERAHLKRGDHIIKPLGFFILAVHWFNPLVWVAYILLCRDIEYACDEKVINDLAPEARKAYAYALLDCAVAHKRIIACPVAFGETGVKGRVKKTMSYKKPAFWLILCGIIVCVIVAVLFLTTSSNGGGESSADASDSSAETSEASNGESTNNSGETSDSPYGENELNYIDGLISVEYATDEIIATLGVYDEYSAERDYNTVTTVIFPKEAVTEFAIYRIDVTDDWANSGEFIIKQKLYSQPELNTQKPLVAEIEVGDILPENVISFKTADGRVHYYAVRESNLDGSLNVFSVTPDGENGDNSIPETSEPETSEPETSEPEENDIYVTFGSYGARVVPDKDKEHVELLLNSGEWGEYVAVVPNFTIQIGETKYEYALDIGNVSCNGRSKTLPSSDADALEAVLTEMFAEYFEENEESEPENHVHSYGDWQTVTAASCKQTGRNVRTCACGASEYQIVPVTEHSYVNNVCSVCGASNEPAFVPDYSAGQANVIGNTRANSQAAEQGNWLYYADGVRITKINKSSYATVKVCSVSSGNIYNLNVVGDWLYFWVRESAVANSYIAKVRTDGSKFTKLLVTGEVWEMLVVKETVYYTPVKNPYTNYVKDVAPLYTMTVNGASVKQISDGCVSNLCADASYIYYTVTKDYYSAPSDIYRMKHNGSSGTTLWLGGVDGFNHFTVYDSRIYMFQLELHGDFFTISSVSTNGGDYKSYCHIETYSETLAVYGNKICFTGMACGNGEFSEEFGLVCYNTSNGSYSVLEYEYEDIFFTCSDKLIVPVSSTRIKIYDLSKGTQKTVSLQ